MFSQVCVRSHLQGGAVPQPADGGYPIPGLDGGTPFQVLMGVPHPRYGCGYPILGLDRVGTPSKVWTGGIPHPADGGYPILGLDRGYPILLMGGTPFEIRTGG